MDISKFKRRNRENNNLIQVFEHVNYKSHI